MSSSVPLQLAETLQTAHINPSPSPQHDLNPSTAASRREPVQLEPVFLDDGEIEDVDAHSELDDEEEEDEEDLTEDEELYRSRIKPRPRRHNLPALPPLPDLRFEQSYLWSIRNADAWWKVVWITVRDQVSPSSRRNGSRLRETGIAQGMGLTRGHQVMMPFVQGILYNLAVCGWQYWNRNARIHGSSIGARLRRWWYGVNSWPIPPHRKVDMRRKAW